MRLLIFFICTWMLGFPTHQKAGAQSRISNMRTEYFAEPLGLDTQSPRFTWEMESPRKGFLQESFRLMVASSPELLEKGAPDIWTSGKVKSTDNRSFLKTEGILKPHSRYFWRVEVWEKSGKKTLSPVASFETAKLNPLDWSGKWISDNFNQEFRKSPMFRKGFVIGKEIKQARAYVCGLGYTILFINGKKVGDHWLDPGYTHFDKQVLYATYDITAQLRAGDNAVAAVLGNGWYNIQSLAVWGFHNSRWRDRPRILCEIRIVYADGTVEVIATDDSWKTNTGPYLFNNLYSGDVYDARLEKPGWNDIGYDDRNWTSASLVDSPAPRIASQQMPPIRITEEVKPVSMKSFPDNIHVFSFDKNMAGVCRLRVKGEKGTRIEIRHGELLHPDGRLNQGNIDVYFQREKNGMPWHQDPAETFQTDVYYMKGDGTFEEFTPSFTYHGFQYVEIQSSKPVEVSRESLTGLFLNTDVQSAGSFSCSNEVLNKLAAASRRSYLSNLHSIPTDCPQREKNGWTADGYISMELGLLNFDGITLYEKWLRDFADNQREGGEISGIIPSSGWGYADWIGPVWDAGMFIIPYNLYLYYGDKRAIEEIYPVCEKYLKYLQTRETDGKLTYGIGDWVFYKAKTPTDFTSTAFYRLDNVYMTRFSEILGKDPSPYRKKADELKKLINDTWYNPETSIYANGTQAAQAVALALGLVDNPDEQQKIAENLVKMIRGNNHQLDFGMLGSKFVPAILTKFGYAEDAYEMITKETAPSWGNWISMGLTTLPETWMLDKNFKDASLNHVFLGDITAWMTKTIAGINFDENQPGFRHVILRPHFLKDLSWAKGDYNSVNGKITSEWHREAGKIKLTVSVPANTTATLYTNKTMNLGSGSYTIIFPDK